MGMSELSVHVEDCRKKKNMRTAAAVRTSQRVACDEADRLAAEQRAARNKAKRRRKSAGRGGGGRRLATVKPAVLQHSENALNGSENALDVVLSGSENVAAELTGPEIVPDNALDA